VEASRSFSEAMLVALLLPKPCHPKQYITLSGNSHFFENEMMQFYVGELNFGVINRLYSAFSFLLVPFL